MAAPGRNKFRTPGSSGASIAALVILVVIIALVLGYFLLKPAHHKLAEPAKPEVSPSAPALVQPPLPQKNVPEPATVQPPADKQPHVYPSTTVPPETVIPGVADGSPARLAIIIDDMGGSLSEARTLAAIGVPLTFSIIPGLHKDTEVAAYAQSQHIETMIHIPMQSKGWPGTRLEPNGLLVAMADAELRERVAAFAEQFPAAVGANNHMGSEFTEHADKMRSVLEVLKGRELFFVDSVTSPHTVAAGLSRQLGLMGARRNVFLDNQQERGYILGQLGQAVRLAKKSGSAIAICHPHAATIAALVAALPALASQGVTLVPASQLVK